MIETVHLSQSITGPLLNWTSSDWQNATKWITKKDGSAYSARELKMLFIQELSKGHEVIPMGDCDNFDYKRGCLGHTAKSAGTAEEPK